MDRGVWALHFSDIGTFVGGLFDGAVTGMPGGAWFASCFAYRCLGYLEVSVGDKISLSYTLSYILSRSLGAFG
jgi:hypothetical protein